MIKSEKTKMSFAVCIKEIVKINSIQRLKDNFDQPLNKIHTNFKEITLYKSTLNLINTQNIQFKQ